MTHTVSEKFSKLHKLLKCLERVIQHDEQAMALLQTAIEVLESHAFEPTKQEIFTPAQIQTIRCISHTTARRLIDAQNSKQTSQLRKPIKLRNKFRVICINNKPNNPEENMSNHPSIPGWYRNYQDNIRASLQLANVPYTHLKVDNLRYEINFYTHDPESWKIYCWDETNNVSTPSWGSLPDKTKQAILQQLKDKGLV